MPSVEKKLATLLAIAATMVFGCSRKEEVPADQGESDPVAVVEQTEVTTHNVTHNITPDSQASQAAADLDRDQSVAGMIADLLGISPEGKLVLGACNFSDRALRESATVAIGKHREWENASDQGRMAFCMSATLVSIESQDPVRAMATAKVMLTGLDAYHAALNTPAGQDLGLTNLDIFTLIKNTAPNELKSDVDKEIENSLKQVRDEKPSSTGE